LIVERLKRVRAKRDIRRYLSSTSSAKLNVGCGGNIVVGWLNVDSAPRPGAVYLDGSAAWPFPDGTFDAVLAEHVIEHVPKADGRRLLAEARRVLRPGAVVRIATPDMKFFARLISGQVREDDDYLSAIGKFRSEPAPSRCDAVNIIFRDYGHRYIYTEEELADMMAEAGFSNLRRSRAGSAIDPIFLGAEGHGAVVRADINAQTAFAIEGTR
jgi:predicted SAM-dependent methyltransferase